MKPFRLLAGLAIAAYFLVSLLTLSNYGINWDEVNHSMRGQAYLYYFLTGKKDYDQSLFAPGSRHSFYKTSEYGFRYQMKIEGGHPALSDILSSLFNVVFYQKLGIVGDFEGYHLYGVVLVTLFLVFIYWWVERTFGGFTALVSVMSIVLYPLFYGESHFNVQKDIPEAVYLTTAAIVFYESWVRRSFRLMLLAAVLAGVALWTKFNVIFLVPVVVLWFLRIGLKRSIRRLLLAPRKFQIVMVALPGIAFAIFWGSWPWLWQNPVGNLAQVLGYYRTMGMTLQPAFPPEYYLFRFNTYPVGWILFTTPLITLFLTSAGIWWVLRHGWQEKHKVSFYILLLFIVPVMRVTIPFTSIYGGVRQIMEYIPAMAILAGLGAKYLLDIFKTHRLVVAFAILVSFIPITIKMVSMHPNESIYFNPLIGGLSGAAERNIPGWGNSLGSTYRQGTRWLNEHAEEGAKLSTTYELRSNIPLSELRGDIDYQNRYKSGIFREGEYIIGVTHFGTRESSYHRKYLERFLDPVYELRVEGVPLLKVWKNDLAHTKAQYRLPDKAIGEVKAKAGSRLLLIDLGGIYKLTRLELMFSPHGCQMEEGGRIDARSEGKQWINVYPELLAISSFSRFVPYPEPGHLQYLFAAEEVQFVQITHFMPNSCLLTRPVSVRAWGY